MPRFAALLLLVLGAAACASSDPDSGRYSMSASPGNDRTATAGQPARMDPTRSITDRDCSRPIEAAGGNLRCR